MSSPPGSSRPVSRPGCRTSRSRCWWATGRPGSTGSWSSSRPAACTATRCSAPPGRRRESRSVSWPAKRCRPSHCATIPTTPSRSSARSASRSSRRWLRRGEPRQPDVGADRPGPRPGPQGGGRSHRSTAVGTDRRRAPRQLGRLPQPAARRRAPPRRSPVRGRRRGAAVDDPGPHRPAGQRDQRKDRVRTVPAGGPPAPQHDGTGGRTGRCAARGSKRGGAAQMPWLTFSSVASVIHVPLEGWTTNRPRSWSVNQMCFAWWDRTAAWPPGNRSTRRTTRPAGGVPSPPGL